MPTTFRPYHQNERPRCWCATASRFDERSRHRIDGPSLSKACCGRNRRCGMVGKGLDPSCS